MTLSLDRPAAAAPSRLVLPVIATGMVMAMLDTTIVTVALPDLRATLGATVGGLTWIVDAYTLSFVAFMLTAGVLSDRIGAKTVFLLGLVVFAAASAACGLAPTAAALVAARMAQGAGAALFLPSSLALLRHAYAEPAARARALGLWSGIAASAGAAGPVLGGILVQHAGWRAIFLVNLPVGLAGLALGLRCLDRAPARAGRGLDLPGQAAALLALGALSVALIQGPETGWASPPILAAFASAALGLALLLRIEARSRSPMMPLGLFAAPGFAAAAFAGFTTNCGYFGALFALGLYLRQGLGLAPAEAGVALLPLVALTGIGNVVSGRLVARVGPWRQMTAGLAAAAAGFLLLAAAAMTGRAGLMTAGMPLAALGTAAAVAPAMAVALGSVAADRAGIAAGLIQTIRQSGNLIGIALAGAAAATLPVGAATAATMAGSAVIYGAGAAVTILRPRARPQD